MIVAAGQFVPKAGDMAANSHIMSQQMANAAAVGASLIVFPELCLTGYLTPEELLPLAVSPDSMEIAALRDTACRSGIDIAFGFSEKTDTGTVYNSMVYIDQRGEIIATYHKVHLWDSEKQWAKPGEGFAAFDTGEARCGMWICYDTRFPEAARLLAIDGATLGLVATAWLGPAAEWELALRARAMDNGMYVVGSALQGAHGPFVFNGSSLIVDPHGQVLAEAEEGAEAVITAEYNEAVLRRFRERLPLLAHRRLDVYGALLHPASW